MKLAKKIVLVAGAGRGTGRAIALELAKAGADVTVCARTKTDIDNVAAEIEVLGRQALAVKADLSDPLQAESLVKKTIDQFGGVDVLVYNAAAQDGNALTELTNEQWDEMFDVNLKGFFICARGVVRNMIDRGIQGKIVAVSSIAGIDGFPNSAHYCASKGGMIAMIKALGIELGTYGITANAVAPGFIWGDLMQAGKKSLGSAVIDEWKKRVPLGKFARQEDIARAVAFLASEDADYLTGSVITVDGGLTLANLPMK